jgi:hypothetical protein
MKACGPPTHVCVPTIAGRLSNIEAKAQQTAFPYCILKQNLALSFLFSNKTSLLCPNLSEEEWDKLLQRSPLFQLLRKVELGLKEQALDAGFLKGELRSRFDEKKLFRLVHTLHAIRR